MTKKDFEMIAAIVADIRNADDRAATATHFANKLSATNPRFDRARFIAACNAL